MQKFTKEELQEQAETFMEAYGVDKFYATEDGNFFEPANKSLAYDHNNKVVKGEEVFEFSVPPVEGAPEPEPTHEEKVAEVKSAITEIQGLGETDPEKIKAELLKGKFEPAIVEEVLNDVSTHKD